MDLSMISHLQKSSLATQYLINSNSERGQREQKERRA